MDPQPKKPRLNGDSGPPDTQPGSPAPTCPSNLYSLKYTLETAAEPVNAVKIAADNTKIATCTSAGLIRVYSFASGELLCTLTGHTKGVSDIAFSPIDSDTLALALDDLTIRLWSVRRRRCVRVLRKHTYHVTAVVFNSKGSVLVSAAADETVVVWDLASGRSFKTLAAHLDPVSSVSLTPDDSMIVSASYDGLMRLFDAETGQCLKTLVYNSTSHGTATASTLDVVNFPILRAVFSPNGKYILSSSLDGKLRLWDYMNNRVVKTYLGPGGALVNATYNSGSAVITRTPAPLVASGSDSHGVLFWDLQSRDIVAQLQPGATVLDVTVCDGGLFLAACDLHGHVWVYELADKHRSVARKPAATPDLASETPVETPVETPADTPMDSAVSATPDVGGLETAEPTLPQAD